MSWADAYLVAVRSVVRRLGRAALTVMAVILAAALLSALLIATASARSRVLDAVAGGGPLSGIQVLPAAPDSSQLDIDSAQPGEINPIDDTVRDRVASVSGVKSVVALSSVPVFVVPPVSTKSGAAPSDHPRAFGDSLTGVDLRRTDQLPITVLAGRLPKHQSLHEIAVTESYLRHIGVQTTDTDSVLGTVVEMNAAQLAETNGQLSILGRWTRSTIVGVVAAQGTIGGFVGSHEQVRAAREWSAASEPTTDPRQQRFAASLRGTSTYSGLFVVTDGLHQITPVRAKINKLGFATSAPETIIASVERYSRVVEIVLSGIGLIALAIAALGITNAMLAAVRERRREIGVLKAIGARDRDIRRIFLIEASILGLAGGLIGTTAGYAVARVVGFVVNRYLDSEGIQGVSVGFPVGIVFVGVLGSTVLALIAGTVPAQRAARLPARQAMGDA